MAPHAAGYDGSPRAVHRIPVRNAPARGEFGVGQQVFPNILLAGIEAIAQDEFQHRLPRSSCALGEAFEAALLRKRKSGQRHRGILAAQAKVIGCRSDKEVVREELCGRA